MPMQLIHDSIIYEAKTVSTKRNKPTIIFEYFNTSLSNWKKDRNLEDLNNTIK